MTDTTAIQEKKPISFYESQPEKYRLLSNGAVLLIETGKIIASFPELNPHAFTSANSHEIQRLSRIKKLRSKLMGIADLTHSPADVSKMTDEQLIEAGGDSVRFLTAHLGVEFLASRNVRGLAESYSKLVDALAEEPNRQALPEPLPQGAISMNAATLLELARQIEAHTAAERDKARSLDAEVINSDAEKWAKGEA